MENNYSELFNQSLARGGADAITGFKDPTKFLKLKDSPFSYFAGVDSVDTVEEEIGAITVYIKRGVKQLYSTTKDTFEEIVEAINSQDLNINVKLVKDE